jgi:hypothetical protein
MQVRVHYKGFRGSSTATCTGVLPRIVAQNFRKVTCLQVQDGYIGKDTNREEEDFLIENTNESRSLFLLEKFSVLNSLKNKIVHTGIPRVIQPACIRVRYTDESWGILFLPPHCWKWDFSRAEFKHPLGCYWDLGRDLQSEIEPPEEDINTQQQTLDDLCADINPIEWLTDQANQVIRFKEEGETFKGVSLGKRATGHRMLCERLEKDGYMFIFEAPFYLPGDILSGWSKRRMDLMIFRNQTALIIEIDGTQHGEWRQRGDDYERDSLIGRHWLKMRRFRNTDIVNNLDNVMAIIENLLDPRSNTSAL